MTGVETLHRVHGSVPSVAPRPGSAPPGAQHAPIVRFSARTRFVAALVLVAYLLAILFVSSGVGGSSGAIISWLAVEVGVVVALLCTWCARLGFLHPMTVFLGFVALDLMRRFDLYAYGLTSHQALGGSQDVLNGVVVRELQLTVLSIVTYSVGAFIYDRRRRPVAALDADCARNPIGSQRLLVPAFAISLVGTMYLAQTSGGLLAHLDALARGRQSLLSGQFLALMVASLALPASWLMFAERGGHLRRGVGIAAAMGSLVLVFVASGSRAIFLYGGLVFMMLSMLRTGRPMYGRAIVLAVLALSVVSSLGVAERDAWTSSFDLSVFTDISVVEALQRGFDGEFAERTSSGSGALAILGNVPDHVGYLNGSSYVAALAAPIPRAIFPAKPGQIDGQVGRAFFGSPSGRPPSAIGEAYWNFGVPGVAILFGIFGAVHMGIADAFRRRRTSPSAAVLYAVTLVFLVEPVTSGYVNWLQWFVPVLLLAAIGRRLRS